MLAMRFGSEYDFCLKKPGKIHASIFIINFRVNKSLKEMEESLEGFYAEEKKEGN
jgi:hypothetical protein